MADLQGRAARLSGLALAVGAAALLLTGCAGSPTPTAAPASTQPAAPAAPPMDSGDPTAGIPTTAGPEVPQGRRTPADVAGAAMTAYAVSAPVDKADWYRRIAPYLSDDARREYVYTDPANVPVHQLVGVPRVIHQTTYLVIVAQSTDVGRYLVYLVRGDDGAWQVYRIDPPAQAPASS